jgi:hypothetical protein
LSMRVLARMSTPFAAQFFIAMHRLNSRTSSCTMHSWESVGSNSELIKKMIVDAEINGSDCWQRAVSLTKELKERGKNESQEDWVGDIKLKIFPVRTALSRYCLNNADCLVWIGTPFGPDSATRLSSEQQKRLENQMARLALRKKGKIAFHVSQLPDGQKSVQSFRETLKELTSKFGFQDHSLYVHSVRE